jgi:hypothetical protein
MKLRLYSVVMQRPGDLPGEKRSEPKQVRSEPNMLGLLLTLRFTAGWTDEQIEGWKIMLDRNVNSSPISP